MKIGLTGGIGCGKSLALAYFAEAGAATVETDRVARKILKEDAEVQNEVRARWGAAVFQEDGCPNRGAIAQRVFTDPGELRFLEELLHPRVRQHWTRMVEMEPARIWVVEILLLFEKRLETHFDYTVCIASEDAVWRHRLLQRGLRAEDIAQRVARQLPLAEKISRANYVILNNGSKEFLRKQVVLLLREVASLATPS